jgi:maltose O-acetyltransferase
LDFALRRSRKRFSKVKKEVQVMQKLVHVIREELFGLHIGFLLADFILKFIPAFVGGRLRVRILRLAGFRIGKKSIIMGKLRFIGGPDMVKNFEIGPSAFINVDCFFDMAAPISIGENVSIGPQAMIITGNHHIGDEANRCSHLDPRGVIIGDGVWLGARCIILPGISVGRGSVVAAGAVVTKDVPINTMVAGVPARVIKELPTSNELLVSANGHQDLWIGDTIQPASIF